MSKECTVCYWNNPGNADECEECGAVLRTDVAALGAPCITLISIIDKTPIILPGNGAVLGRSCGIAPELFNHKWVSESHCRVSVDGSDCYIEDIGSDGNGSTNGTFLNGDKLPKRTSVKFFSGNKLKIAHLMFDIKVEYPQSEEAGPATSAEEQEILTWVIECPVSGRRYEVDGSSYKIEQCGCCEDLVDKKRISKVKPKQVRE
ncbi:MAG: FHA domain-containing protein [Oscillospiraceae bacterium]|nr:FHA domain-containing protein [Oscillospiraceae bacterium]